MAEFSLTSTLCIGQQSFLNSIYMVIFKELLKKELLLCPDLELCPDSTSFTEGGILLSKYFDNLIVTVNNTQSHLFKRGVK